MTDGSGAASARYRAFISYSHRDAVFAARLHRRLETYVLPKPLGAERRLTPIFKDREELPAAHDLSAQVRAALAMSDCLIVVCSPDAVASPWVGREIALFRELQPDRPILAALVRGEPAEAFPPLLADGGVEPLAADFREDGDGERLALLKLVAGIAKVGVDQLVQRDAQRRLRGVMGVTAMALVGMLAMAAMTTIAFEARAEAERQQAEADGLVFYMLTDLREKLKGAGSLEVRSSANRRALEYYAKQDLARLPPAALSKRAQLLHAMGEDDLDRGDLAAAAVSIAEARRVTDALLKRSPADPDRIWVHAQSTYWQGRLASAEKRPVAARAAWLEYGALADRLLAQTPTDKRSLLEVAYANNTLCSLAVEQHDGQKALSLCSSAATKMKRALASDPTDPQMQFDMATAWGWLADAQIISTQLDLAHVSRLRQIEILETLLRSEPNNAKYIENITTSRRGMARIFFLQGKIVESIEQMNIVHDDFTALVSRDPKNAEWQKQLQFSEKSLKFLNDDNKTER